MSVQPAAVSLPFDPARSGAIARLATIVAVALLVGMLGADGLGLIRTGTTAILSPFGVDYGEGIVWQQMLNIMAGRGYAPLTTFPAIVFHYPPVYHLTVGFSTALTGADGLAVGRSVSLIATLATAWLVGSIAQTTIRCREGAAPAAGGWLAGLIYLSCWPVADWSALMRVDMLSMAFGMGGLLLALRSVKNGALIHAASLCFLLAIFTKQVCVAAPAAAFIGLFAVRRRLALIMFAECMIGGALALMVLELTTGGGFLRHIIFYNLNRNLPERLMLLISPIAMHGVYIVLATAGVLWAVRTVRENWADRAVRPAAIAIPLTLATFLLLKTILLALIVKSGSAANYMIEWFAAIAIFAGSQAAPALATGIAAVRGHARAHSWPHLCTLLLLAVQALIIPSKGGVERVRSRGDAEQLTALVTAIRAQPRPVISDEMTLLIRAGKPVLWEPSITAELGAVGRYDQAGFVTMIEQRKLGFFITEGDRGDWLFDTRYNPPVARAMASYYPVERKVAGLTVHLPPPDIDTALDRSTAALLGRR